MDVQTIKDTQIFSGMSEKEITAALAHLSSHEEKYRKGNLVFHAGNVTDNMGLVLQGSVTIESNDLWGNRTILSRVEKGEFFAETYGFLGT